MPEIIVTTAWATRADMPDIMDIERSSFADNVWTEEDFTSVLQRRDVVGLVAKVDDTTVGFMVYEFNKTQITILNLAVHPDARRNGVGRKMVNRLRDMHAGATTRRVLNVFVRETSMDALLFFKACGWYATNLIPNRYSDCDGILMRVPLSRLASELPEVKFSK